jgi:hypothetical protein
LYAIRDKRASVVNELRHYRLLAVEFTDCGKNQVSALQFWSAYVTSSSLLSFLAKRFASTPDTSLPSETVFSVSSSIARKERCRVTPENLAATMFL